MRSSSAFRRRSNEYHEPDLSYVTGTVKSIAPHVHEGQLIVLESTTYPGTTEDIVVPLLEQGNPRGLKVSRGADRRDFMWLFRRSAKIQAMRPSRGTIFPKWSAAAARPRVELAAALYGSIFRRIVPVSSPAVAEMTKLLENIYRCVNIALVNELKQLCMRMEIDIHEVIDAARTKPFGFQAFYPGPGSAGTAFPSIPFTSRGRRRNTTSAPDSSSWPAKSIPTCPTSSSSRPPRR